MIARYLYYGALSLLVIVIVAIGGADFLLWLFGLETISGFLRVNPVWFWGPVAAVLVFIGLLTWHLFGRKA